MQERVRGPRKEARMSIRIVETRRFRDAATGDGLHPQRPISPSPGSVGEYASPHGRFGYDSRMEEEMPERLDRIRCFPGAAHEHDGRSTRRFAQTAKSDEAFSFLPGRYCGRAPSDRSGAFLSGSRDFKPRGATR